MDVIDEAKLAAAMKPLVDEMVAAVDRFTGAVEDLRSDLNAIKGITLQRDSK